MLGKLFSKKHSYGGQDGCEACSVIMSDTNTQKHDTVQNTNPHIVPIVRDRFTSEQNEMLVDSLLTRLRTERKRNQVLQEKVDQLEREIKGIIKVANECPDHREVFREKAIHAEAEYWKLHDQLNGLHETLLNHEKDAENYKKMIDGYDNLVEYYLLERRAYKMVYNARKYLLKCYPDGMWANQDAITILNNALSALTAEYFSN